MVGQVYHSTALELLKGLPAKSVGAIISDPPFHISTRRADDWKQTCGIGSDPWTDVHSIDEIIDWTKPHVVEAARVLRPGGALVVMGGTQSLLGWDLTALKLGFQWMAEIVVLWNTGKPRLHNFGSLHTRIVWYCRTGLRHTFNTEAHSIYSNVLVCKKIPPDGDRRHPSEKPVGLTNFLVSLLSKEGDTIVDPFMGSGSTLVSSIQCSRNYIGADIDLAYVKSTRKRLQMAEEEIPEPVYLWVNGRLEEV